MIRQEANLTQPRSHWMRTPPYLVVELCIVRFLKTNPQNDPEEFLQQLELHERLHCYYESGKLSKNVLSAYLCMTIDHRHTLLKWMGSSMMPTGTPITAECDVPLVPLRLHKIPGNIHVLGDKGFRETHGDCPNANVVHTPETMNNLPIYQYHEAEGDRKKKLCSLRWISEGEMQRQDKTPELGYPASCYWMGTRPY